MGAKGRRIAGVCALGAGCLGTVKHPVELSAVGFIVCGIEGELELAARADKLLL